jgi:hypothetical protein
LGKFFLFLLFVLVLTIAWMAFGVFRRTRFSRQIDRARRQFSENRSFYEKLFYDAATASGKPRGLTWREANLDDRLILARDRANGELVGLVGVTISFDAIEGGGMEHVEAVGNLRAATAVFTHNGNDWTTLGRTIFNLEPREALARHRESLDAVRGN